MLKNIILLFMILSFPLYMRGEEVCRIVSLSPAVTEIICHLGGEKYLAGRSSACNYPESVKKLPVAGDFAKPYMEKILLFRPRYLLTNDLINPAAAKKFDSVGIKCVMKQIADAEDYFHWVKFAGKILKKEKAALQEIKRVKKLLAELAAKQSGKKKKALWIIWDSPIMVAGKNSLLHNAMEYAQCRNVAENVKSDYFRASAEWLAKSDPDFIIFPQLTEKKRQELSKKYPWKSLKAWREGKIISQLPEDLLLRPGPRFFDGVNLLHKEIYTGKK